MFLPSFDLKPTKYFALATGVTVFRRQIKLRLSAPLGLPKSRFLFYYDISKIDGATAEKPDLEGQPLRLIERY